MSKRSRRDAVRVCLDRVEPSAEIVRVEEAPSLWRPANLSWSRRMRTCLGRGDSFADSAPVDADALSLWRRASLPWARRSLCEDHACRSNLTVAPREWRRPNLPGARRTLCENRARRSALAAALCKFPHIHCSWSGLCKLSLGLGTCFDFPLVSFKAKRIRKLWCRDSGGKIAKFEHRSSLRSAFPQLRMKSHASSGQAGRKEHSRGSGSTLMALERKSSTRSVLP